MSFHTKNRFTKNETVFCMFAGNYSPVADVAEAVISNLGVLL
jgi:hypothetical protein